MNTNTLLGRATSQIECKQTPAGKSVCSFSIAVKRPFVKDTTDFFNVTAWDKLAETIAKYVNKGDQICIRGFIQNRSWEDNIGNKRTVTEVVAQDIDFCTPKNSAQGTEASTPTNHTPQYAQKAQMAKFEGVEDQDLPF
jgi:single-strand DNA-binding protein